MGAWEFFPLPVEVWNGPVFRQAYLTLKGAFDAINAGTWTGNLTIIFRGNTTETATAMLNASGTGSSSYSRILIIPGRSGIRISGNLAAPLVDLNGARHVTFDGRVNGTGTPYEMTITNINNSTTSATSVIRFINSATNDTIRFTALQGASNSTTAGIVYFATATAGSGNNNNVLFSNRITSTSTHRPLHAVFSLGSASFVNSGNKIESNDFFNFLNQGAESFGVHIAGHSSGFSILNNSFYETTTFVPTASVVHRIIHINNSAGNTFVVSGNHIGGNAPLSSGTWNKTNAQNNEFHAISLHVGNTASSSIQGNTIRNFNYANSAAANWHGIRVTAGKVHIGTTTGNTLGASTGNGSITITQGAHGGFTFPVSIASPDSVICSNNIIASINASTANALHGHHLVAIHKTATAGVTQINRNTIGSATTTNSLQATSTATANAQNIFGIYSEGTGAITVSENQVMNLRNATTNSTATTTGRINGIWVSAGSANVIFYNLVRDLSIANANTALTFEASVVGINISGTVAGQDVSRNTIHSLSNTFTTLEHHVMGLRYEGGTTGTNTVSRNFIHSLLAGSASASVTGIRIAGGSTTYSNNIVTLGSSANHIIFGVHDGSPAGNVTNLYFNTIYIGGSTTGTAFSYAMFTNSTNPRNYRNNIFANGRTRTTSGSHFAIYHNVINTNLTINFNNYWVLGTGGGVLGFYPNTNRTTITDIRTATGQDQNSISQNPQFVLAGSIVAADYRVGVSQDGTAGTGVAIDYGSYSRPGADPTMGAWEFKVNRWKGNVSTDWGTAANWTGNVVPPVDATIEFDPIPLRHCIMDQNRSVTHIINDQGAFRVVTNGFKLTIKGDLMFTNGAQIDASAPNSLVEFAGDVGQTIPSGSFFNNQVFHLNIHNANNVVLSGTLRLLQNITSTAGRIDLTTNGTNFVFAGSSLQHISDRVFLNERMHNLIIDNSAGVDLNTDLVVDNYLTIHAGRRLNINPLRSMSVLGLVTNHAGTSGLRIRSSSTLPNGTFIFNNSFHNPVEATVEMYSKATFDLNQQIGRRFNWQFFGIPVRSIGANPTFAGSFVRRKVEWGTTIYNHWLPLNNDSVLSPFVGYEITHQTPRTIIFAGQLVNHNFYSGQLPITSGALYPGEYLFSNPYTAAIDIRQIDFGSGTDETAYMYSTGTFNNWSGFTTWGDSPGQYISVPKNLAGTGTLPRTVPSMGNFAAKMLSGTANDYVNIHYNSVVIKNNEMQRIGSASKQEVQDGETDHTTHLMVDLVSEQGFDRLWVYSGDTFSRSLDRGFDGRKLLSFQNTLQLFSPEGDEIYQVNAVDNLNNTTIAFRTGNETEFSLIFNAHQLHRRYSAIYLHDKWLNRIVDITGERFVYDFKAESDAASGSRFRILTSTLDQREVKNGISMFSANQTVYVKNHTDKQGDFRIYDLSGRLLARTKVDAGAISFLNVPNQHVCLVQFITPEISESRSLIIPQ